MVADTISEQELENGFVKQLIGLGYDQVKIPDETALENNFRKEFIRHNQKVFADAPLTDKEFASILTEIKTPRSYYDLNLFLREKQLLTREDGTIVYYEFLNAKQPQVNHYQVTHQTTVTSGYTVRYDVVILINGIPQVQIELKKSGKGLMEAYGQIRRYHKQLAGLFRCTLLWVISNDTNTRYTVNNKRLAEFSNMFIWSTDDNKKLNKLTFFTDSFLDRTRLGEMLYKYVVFSGQGSDRHMVVLRPYQVYAVERLVGKVAQHVYTNGYIWHTTGSGKTLTSFKTSQILSATPYIDKVLFVVDRNDLDYQTQREFNKYAPGSVDGTEDTKALIKQLLNPNTKLIITTIQKLNHAIKRAPAPLKELAKTGRFVLIFDECHRTQFGETHERIDDFFKRKNLFGFTGTPIFAENNVKKRTTKDLFGECLHRYLIKDAINDNSVLAFSVEYVGKEDGIATSADNFDDDGIAYDDVGNPVDNPADSQADNENDTPVEADVSTSVDSTTEANEGTPEAFNANGNVNGDKKDMENLSAYYKTSVWREHVTDFIVTNHKKKCVRNTATNGYVFHSLFAVSGVSSAIEYYSLFHQAYTSGKSDMKVAVIYTYDPNGLPEYLPTIDDELGITDKEIIPSSARDMLENAMQDYNTEYGTNFSLKTNGFAAYYQDVSKKLRKGQIDMLIVVNMFLTGYDSPMLNTLYVDKNLHHHGLLQAFSRTNRVIFAKDGESFGVDKTHGNIVAFRPLKQRVDDAITLFADPEASSIIIRKPYHELRKILVKQATTLKTVAPQPDTVDTLEGDTAKAEFASKFRDLLKTHNEISMYTKFETDDPWGIDEQEFLDFKSKYSDLKVDAENERKSAQPGDELSDLAQFDFDLVSLQKDKIDVDYIIKLLGALDRTNQSAKKLEQDINRIEQLVEHSDWDEPKKDMFKTYIAQEVQPSHKPLPPLVEFDTFLAQQYLRAMAKGANDFGVPEPVLKAACEQYSYDGKINEEELLNVSTKVPTKFLEKRSWKKKILATVHKLNAMRD